MFKKLLLTFCLLLTLSSTCAAHDYIIERAYVEDPLGSLSPDTVKSQPETPFTGMFTKGFSRSTFWIRLKIDAAPNLASQKLRLRIMPTYLDSVTLYDHLDQSGELRITGDRQAFALSEHQSLSFNFEIPATKMPRDVWLKLKTNSTNLMQVRALEAGEADVYDQRFAILTAALFAVMVIFLIWAILQWIATKERLIGIFIIRQFAGLLFFSSFVGYFRFYLPDTISPALLDAIFNALIFLASMTAVWFHREFFVDYAISRWVKLPFDLLLLFFPIEFYLALSDRLSLALEMNMTIVLILPFYMLLVAAFLVPWHKLQDNITILPRSVLIVFHVVFLVVSALAALPSLGIARGSELAPHSVLLHGFVTGVVLLSMMTYRSRRIFQKQVLDIAIANQYALDEKRYREEDRRFMEMLSHEFKNGLAILRMSLDRSSVSGKSMQHADRAIHNMNEVLERLMQVQSMEDRMFQVSHDNFALAEVLKDVVASSKAPDRVRVACDPLITARTDAHLIKVIIANLLDNAIKYSPAASFVDIIVIAKPDVEQWAVLVKNQVGRAGTPDPAMLFKKYYRAQWAQEKMGSGLGLYLIKEFAGMLGMTLTYQPNNQEVVFKLCLEKSA